MDGKAGHHVGRRMRRGTIAVRGSCGDGVMMDAIAGTVSSSAIPPTVQVPELPRFAFLLGQEEPQILPNVQARERHSASL